MEWYYSPLSRYHKGDVIDKTIPMMDRKILLQKLIKLDGSLETILPLLRLFDWDSDHSLVILQRKDIIVILQKYLENKLTAPDVEKWANAIEGRDDVGYEDGYTPIILSAINQLANPILTRELNAQAANELIVRLS